MAGLTRAAFLDRDGTLNRKPPDHHYLTAPDAFEWLAGAREGAARLTELGFLLTVVSNQRGVARGLVSEQTLRSIEEKIQEGLRPFGVSIAAFRYCTHELDAGCRCRKPAPGLLRDLAADFSLNMGQCWMLGDAETDVAAGRAAGCRTARIGTDAEVTAADVVASTLLDASRAIAALSSAG